MSAARRLAAAPSIESWRNPVVRVKTKTARGLPLAGVGARGREPATSGGCRLPGRQPRPSATVHGRVRRRPRPPVALPPVPAVDPMLPPPASAAARAAPLPRPGGGPLARRRAGTEARQREAEERQRKAGRRRDGHITGWPLAQASTHRHRHTLPSGPSLRPASLRVAAGATLRPPCAATSPLSSIQARARGRSPWARPSSSTSSPSRAGAHRAHPRQQGRLGELGPGRRRGEPPGRPEGAPARDSRP